MSEDGRVASGWWWLPDAPKERIPGVLTIPTDGPTRLRTAGVFERFALSSGRTILGETERGPVGLYQVDPGTQWTRIPEPKVSSGLYHAWTTVLGSATASLDALDFVAMTAEFDQLPVWLFGRDLVRISMPDDQVVVSSSYQLPPLVEAELGELRATVRVGPFRARERDRIVEVERKAWLDLTASDGAVALEVFNEATRCFQAFLSFVTRAPVRVLKTEGRSQRDMADYGDGLYPEPVEIVQHGNFHQAETSPRSLWDSLFQSELLAEFPEGLTRWFALWPKYRSVLAVFTATRVSRMFIEERFLNLAQVAEGIHRRTMSGTYLSGEEYSAKVLPLLVAAIPKTVSGEAKTVLCSRLAFGNELSLRSRVEELVAALPNDGRPLFNARSRFAKEVVAARNGLTHYSTSAPDPDLDRLMILSDHLEVLIELTLLRIMGWPPSLCAKVAMEHPAIRFRRLTEFRNP